MKRGHKSLLGLKNGIRAPYNRISHVVFPTVTKIRICIGTSACLSLYTLQLPRSHGLLLRHTEQTSLAVISPVIVANSHGNQTDSNRSRDRLLRLPFMDRDKLMRVPFRAVKVFCPVDCIHWNIKQTHTRWYVIITAGYLS